VRIEVFEAVSHLLAASVPRAQLVGRVLTWLDGDHGSVRERFSLLRTVLSHAGECEPPRFADDPDDEATTRRQGDKGG
jgi:hypothetical protein